MVEKIDPVKFMQTAKALADDLLDKDPKAKSGNALTSAMVTLTIIKINELIEAFNTHEHGLTSPSGGTVVVGHHGPAARTTPPSEPK